MHPENKEPPDPLLLTLTHCRSGSWLGLEGARACFGVRSAQQVEDQTGLRPVLGGTLGGPARDRIAAVGGCPWDDLP